MECGISKCVSIEMSEGDEEEGVQLAEPNAEMPD